MYVASKGRFKSLAQEFATNYFIQPEVAMSLYKADPRPPPLKAAFAEVSKTDPDMAKILAAGRDRTTLDRYRRLAALRRANHALRRGGLRWAHAEGDAIVFLRESERQRLLALAARAGHRPLRLPTGALGLAGEAPNLYGNADPLRPDPDGSVTLPGDGPTFQLWQLA
jgi:hypothetical protein